MKRIENLRKKNIIVFFSSIVIFTFLSVEAFAQPDANFSANKYEGCTPLQVQFNNQSTGSSLTYSWEFGDGGKSALQNPSHTYYNWGFFTVKLKVTDINGISDSIEKDINVVYTPIADLYVDKTTACVNENITFTHGLMPLVDSVRWNLGDGTTSNDKVTNPLTHIYKANNTYTVTFITYNDFCSDTSTKNVTISGPVTDFTISQDEACIGDSITFDITSTVGVTDIQWNFGDGTTADDLETVAHLYSNYGQKFPKLLVTGPGGSCTLEDTLIIFHVEAAIDYSDQTLFCDERYIYFQNQSTGNDFNTWIFGDGESGAQVTPQHIYQTGDYVVTLIVGNTFGCSDTIADSITINDLPDIQLGEGWFVCEGESDTLFASGGDIIQWNNASTLSDPNSYSPIATPQNSISYQAIVTDTTTKCSTTGSIWVVVQENPDPDWGYTVTTNRDSLVIGDIDTIKYSIGGYYLYNWSSNDSILYQNNNILIIQPVVARNDFAVYNLHISDTNNCFHKDEPINIYVREAYTFGVPEAFSPNNDNINDEIKVDGWGIKRLIEFKVYNRWGTEVYSGDDLNSGWDGNYNNKQQPIDSYAYYIKVEMWDDRVVEKKGTFSLIR